MSFMKCTFPFLFMACPVIIPASAWLQGEIFLSEGQYLYSSFGIHFCLPWTECHADFICCFQPCVLIHDWMKERFQFRGHFQFLASAVSSRSSFLVWIWLIKHTLWKSKSLYSTFTRLHSGVSPSLRSGEQIFMNCSLAWSFFEHLSVTPCHRLYQLKS